MLLQALIHYYDVLAASGKVPPFDATSAPVGFALDLNSDGTVKRIVSLYETAENGKSIPKTVDAPLYTKRSGTASNGYFLNDNTTHMFGCKYKKIGGKSERVLTKECFAKFTDLHHKVLDGCHGVKAKSVLKFVDSITPGEYPQIIDENLEMLSRKKAQPRIMLRDENGDDLFKDPEIRDAWDAYLEAEQTDPNVRKMIDLVDGKKTPVQMLHGSVKGIGNSANGVTLASYNSAAFESYGLKRGEISPMSAKNEQKYVAALNYLFAKPDYVSRIGTAGQIPSLYVTYWAENGSNVYQDIFADEYDGRHNLDRDDLRMIVRQIIAGTVVSCNGNTIRPDEKFYILGISANRARLVVRFFYQSSFGDVLQNVYQHQKRLEIEGAKDGNIISTYRILSETVHQEKGKPLKTNPNPVIAAGLYKAIMQNTYYPEAIYSQMMARIKVENSISYSRAEILKAYLIKNGTRVPKEVLTVSVSKESSYTPYVLGRVFAVLEKIQKDVSPSITSTIKDKYIARAASDPVVVFPRLLQLSQTHQRKLSTAGKVYYSNMLDDLMTKLPENFPKHLTLEEQGAFYLGYYHENQELYKKKNAEDTEEDK